ncbi:hypothetical protein D9615_010495 [Tricholomella constricta]|uniref:Uncharacterized protein n=1 Tax=Tricholomella constricta TaxID=117010 RepID=A0A8H5GN30_9AGAR|nr:hypothetical protein D9615_010495 [Tricholomella constricta]
MSSTDDYPSMLWVTVPPVLLLSAYYVRKWYLARRLRLYGIGKGGARPLFNVPLTSTEPHTAPGFQTNVRRVRVTPEIAARIRRGEDVSPEEIAKAAAEAQVKEAHDPPAQRNSLAGRGVVEERQLEQESGPDTEWLPESITAPKKRAKGKKR